jgi:hypothetical protein
MNIKRNEARTMLHLALSLILGGTIASAQAQNAVPNQAQGEVQSEAQNEAQNEAQSEAQNSPQIGDSTQAWLAMQASNAAAAPAQATPGAQASAAYERYMKSFETAIPEHFTSSVEDAGRPSLDIVNHDAN